MIREYITTYLKSKLKDSPSLVLYDEGRLYKELLPELVNDSIKVFDISTSILSVPREVATTFMTAGKRNMSTTASAKTAKRRKRRSRPAKDASFH